MVHVAPAVDPTKHCSGPGLTDWTSENLGWMVQWSDGEFRLSDGKAHAAMTAIACDCCRSQSLVNVRVKSLRLLHSTRSLQLETLIGLLSRHRHSKIEKHDVETPQLRTPHRRKSGIPSPRSLRAPRSTWTIFRCDVQVMDSRPNGGTRKDRRDLPTKTMALRSVMYMDDRF